MQALQAARLWVEIDPESAQARQMMAGLLVSANRLDELAAPCRQAAGAGGRQSLATACCG
jgi:hypothetical protein